MLDEYEAAAAGFCFSAANERAGHVLQEQIHTNAIEALLFATPPENRYNGPLAGHTFPLTSQAFPSTSRAAGASKPCCSIPGCKRKPAIECTLCKGCCERRGSGCSSTKHRSGPPRTKKVSSFVPDRPSAASPAFPATTNTSPAPSSALSPAGVPAEPLPTSPNTPMIGPRSFREDMPKEWGKEWNVRAKEVDERRAAAELRRRNEVAMARQVIIQLWRQVYLLKGFRLSSLLLTMLHSTGRFKSHHASRAKHQDLPHSQYCAVPKSDGQDGYQRWRCGGDLEPTL